MTIIALSQSFTEYSSDYITDLQNYLRWDESF